MRKYQKTVAAWPSGKAGTFSKKSVESGRNKPCPCGSGKKYKHCCLDKINAPWRELVVAAGIKTEERLKGKNG